MKKFLNTFKLNLFKTNKKYRKKIFITFLGLLIPNILMIRNFKDNCVFEMDLLVSDPITSGKDAGASGLEALGLSSKSTDESTLKAVLASRSVTNLLTKQLKTKYKDDKNVFSLIKKIDSSWNIDSNNTTLRINTKRGDRFQDLSIIKISLVGNHLVLTKINKDIIDFYENYGPIYKANRTKMATQFANSQIKRLKLEYALANKNLREIRKKSFGFDPDYIIELSAEAYKNIEQIKTSAKFDLAASSIISNRDKNFSNIAEKIYKLNLQNTVTSSSFLKILDSYNILKSRYELLSETRPINDKEVNSIKNNLIILEKMFKNKIRNTDLNIDDFPSSEYIGELIGEILKTQKGYSLIEKANMEQEYYKNSVNKSYKLAEDYQLLIGEVSSISSTLSAYNDLKEKLLLDAAQDLSSWNVIGSSIQCSYIRLLTSMFIYSFLYLFAISYFQNKYIRKLIENNFKKLKENF